MSDNRTTELLCKLRKMLDGCRRTETAGFDTYWITAVALDSSLDELERAIAATLGSEREKALEKLARSLYVDYRNEWPDRAEEAYAERMRELGLG